MFLSKLRIVSAALALSVLPLSAGVALADVVVDVPGPPVFYPHAEFKFDNGYYRSNEGHYYHYDRDRDGWHYGRNHREGVRYERTHGHR